MKAGRAHTARETLQGGDVWWEVQLIAVREQTKAGGICLYSKSKGKPLTCFQQRLEGGDEVCFLERSLWLQCGE